MRVVICVPWRGGNPSRERLWAAMRPYMERTGYPVYTGDSDPSRPFNRAEARNVAAEAAGDWDIACFIDADTYIPPDQLEQAIALVAKSGGAALPYTRFLSMHPDTGETRERIMTGGANFLISGDVVVARECFDKVGGWDERISGYGWEDGAFLKMVLALSTLELVIGTMVGYEHTRTEDEEPEVVIARGRPPEADEYDTEEPEALARKVRAYANARHVAREGATID